MRRSRNDDFLFCDHLLKEESTEKDYEKSKVKVDKQTHSFLIEIAKITGLSYPEVLARAISALRKQEFPDLEAPIEPNINRKYAYNRGRKFIRDDRLLVAAV